MFLYPEQLQKKLKKVFHIYSYVLFGNNEFLLEDTKNFILKNIQFSCHYQYLNFLIDDKSIWNTIFKICYTNDLFEDKKKFLYSLDRKKNLIIVLQKIYQFL